MTAPKLRFKEFNGDWSKFSILDLSKDKTLNNGVFNDQNKVGKGYKLINVLDMYIERDIDEARLSLLDLDSKEFERNKVRYGDIFFTRSSLVKEGIAFSNVYLGHSNDVTYDGHLIKLSPDLERVDSLFLNFSLKTAKVRKQLIQGGKTATMTTIGQKEVGSCQLDIPSKEEQTKIASFLSAVDQKISQISQKHELLIQYKQGMMQKLFSQQIRFKADDGREFGEWEEKFLSEIGNFKNGLNKDKESFGFGSPFINLMDVFGKKTVETQNLGLVDASEKDLENYNLKKGDVLFIRSSVKAEGVGQTALVTENLDNVVYSGFLIRFRDTYGLDLGFKKYCFMNNSFRLKLLAKSTTSANTNINQESLSALSIQLPCLEEQTKIANFLSAIDQKIEVVAQQIEQAKTWKKGLLQQMFV